MIVPWHLNLDNAMKEHLNNGQQMKKGQILATDPITNKTIHIGTQMYADDVSDINIITEGSLEEMADDRNKDMDDVLEKWTWPETGKRRNILSAYLAKDVFKKYRT